MSRLLPSVLIVDDHEPDIVLAGITLRKTGRFGTVRSVRSGEEAVALFRDQATPPDAMPALMLLDINMPGLNGFDVLEMLAELPPAHTADTRVVMLTSSLRAQDRERAMQSPLVHGFESKPLTRESAVALLDLLGHRGAEET